jgi:6-pyruvoyltetrahydropterin/6-carboxytetrahydropterin synthase
MVVLTRSVRFAINDPPDSERAVNGFAGAPAMRGLGRHYEIEVGFAALPDPTTGYAIDIHEIDRAVREACVPIIARACRESPGADPARLLPELAGAVAARLDGRTPARLSWRLSPYYRVEWEARSMNSAIIRQQFEFAASHRLHVPSLPAEENRRLFGKCNNPSGHGHNYRVEPAVEVRIGSSFTLADLERITDETVVRRFDHKHLNTDSPEFAGVNPSVENIARIAYDLLAPAIGAASREAKLRSVTVWETDKTSCTYPA